MREPTLARTQAVMQACPRQERMPSAAIAPRHLRSVSWASPCLPRSFERGHAAARSDRIALRSPSGEETFAARTDKGCAPSSSHLCEFSSQTDRPVGVERVLPTRLPVSHETEDVSQVCQARQPVHLAASRAGWLPRRWPVPPSAPRPASTGSRAVSNRDALEVRTGPPCTGVLDWGPHRNFSCGEKAVQPAVGCTPRCYSVVLQIVFQEFTWPPQCSPSPRSVRSVR
jgi:hypothetical protein